MVRKSPVRIEVCVRILHRATLRRVPVSPNREKAKEKNSSGGRS